MIQKKNPSLTRIVVAGHVDHGKSTLIGRLLSDTGQVFPERVAKVKSICEKSGKRFEFAFLLDAFEEEQNQGITIDKTEIPWVYNDHEFLIIDTPGHKEFLKNMISGASTAEIALVMLDAADGVREQFRRHSYILGMLGVKNIIVVINKMDLVNYDQTHFEKLEKEVLSIYHNLKIKVSSIIPISAFAGENLLVKSDALAWFKKDSLADTLLKLSLNKESTHRTHDHLRFSLQDIYKFDENRIYAGKIENGEIAVGDEIKFLPSGSVSKIKSIESWNTKEAPTKALTGTSVGFTFSDPLFLERGEIGFSLKETPPTLSHQVHASLFWMGKKPLEIGKNYTFKMLTQETGCKIESIFNVFNPQHFNQESSQESSQLETSEAGEVIIKFQKSIVCDAFSSVENTGRFVILDDYHIVGGGIIINPNTIFVYKESSHLSKNERSKKFGHEGAVLWLTGLSGAGKSTIAKELERRLFHMNIHSVILDGDNLRKGISNDLGFSAEDRQENIRRTGEVSRLIAESGFISIAALISPLSKDREMVRKLMSTVPFVEIFVDCCIEECERRDSKGLYKKARSGDIKGFTGIDSKYEKPLNAELVLNTSRMNPMEAVDEIINYLSSQKILTMTSLI